ncbi:hypothetical protein EDB86DRAFT_2835416 [Lactarius hatsudake]|nr:hypothetical protein EDB86DRAFT_2835416 [Lactarius hatsudake]
MKSAAVLWQAFAPWPPFSRSDENVERLAAHRTLPTSLAHFQITTTPGSMSWASVLYPGISLLYLDFEEVPRNSPEANMAPVKMKAEKDVRQEQWAVSITAGMVEVIEAA